MSAAEVLAPELSEPLKWVEICTRYLDEWACLVETDRVHPFGFEFRSGRVIGHGKMRRAPIDRVLAESPRLDRPLLHGAHRRAVAALAVGAR